MNRVAAWILGSISGVLLVFGVLAWSLLGISHGYSTMSGCDSYNGGPCIPIPEQTMLSLPNPANLLTGPGTFIVTLAILIGLPAWIATPILALRRGSSARTAILIVAVIASALLIAGAILIPLTSSQELNAQQVCLGNSGEMYSTGIVPQPNCFTGTQGFWIALISITAPPIIAAVLLGMPAWVMTLTQTARLKQWGWFVAAFFLSPIAALLYAFFGAGYHPSPSETAPTAPTVAPVAPAS